MSDTPACQTRLLFHESTKADPSTRDGTSEGVCRKSVALITGKLSLTEQERSQTEAYVLLGLPFYRKFYVEHESGWDRRKGHFDFDKAKVTIAHKRPSCHL